MLPCTGYWRLVDSLTVLTEALKLRCAKRGKAFGCCVQAFRGRIFFCSRGKRIRSSICIGYVAGLIVHFFYSLMGERVREIYPFICSYVNFNFAVVRSVDVANMGVIITVVI